MFQMETKLSGICGQETETKGNGAIIIHLPHRECEEVSGFLKMREAEKDLVDQSYFLHKFHMHKKTFQNWVSKLPKAYYTVMFNHQKLFFLSKMLGLHKVIKHIERSHTRKANNIIHHNPAA